MSESDDEETTDYQFKVTVIGDGTCGKTSLCSRLTQEQFDKSYHQTLGLDFFLKRFSLPGNKNVTMQVWDIGGQQLGGKMIKTYLYGANAVVLVYDVTNYSSFENLSDWLVIVKETFADQDKKPHLALVGNKKDLEHLRTVKKEKHIEFANANGMSNYFLSAKSGDQVAYCFQKIAADILGIRLHKQSVEQANRVVKADIVAYNDNDSAIRSTSAHNKTTFCIIQ
ncbi:ras-related protein Rab-28 [Hydra vulgaris]|nr:ras-related protein Rab-28-like [Hydra vulgaris]